MNLRDKIVKELLRLAHDLNQKIYEIGKQEDSKNAEHLTNCALGIARDFSAIFISEAECKPSWEKLEKEKIR